MSVTGHDGNDPPVRPQPGGLGGSAASDCRARAGTRTAGLAYDQVMAGRSRVILAGAASLLWAGIAAGAVGGAATAAANTTDPIAPSPPCPVQQAPVGPPGVTGVTGVLGAMMNLWQQANLPPATPVQPPPAH